MDLKSLSTKMIVVLGVIQLQACSGQPQKAEVTYSRSNTDDRDAVAQKPVKDKDRDDGVYSGSSGPIAEAPIPTSSTPQIPVPTPRPKPDDDSISPPEIVTGSPTDTSKLQPGQLLRNAFYKLQSSYSKKCLQVAQGVAEAGRQIVQGNCDDQASIFRLNFVDGKFYMLTSKKTNYSVQIRDQLIVSEALLEQGDYRAFDFQKWNLVKQDDGTFHIRPAKNDKLCADIAFGSKDDNAAIQLWRECTQLGARWIIREQP